MVRCKAREILRSESYSQYVANCTPGIPAFAGTGAADGRFPAAA